MRASGGEQARMDNEKHCIMRGTVGSDGMEQMAGIGIMGVVAFSERSGFERNRLPSE